ncbi:MAG TPA: hypothetical protein VMT00_14985 [Thermoanaerobaculia bacterium]|nr:hypothetical protein [Thermoanaerobaculia bacterium]
MNYELAMMALEGLARSPLSVRSEGGELVIDGQPSALKELARLLLLLGGEGVARGEELELRPATHLSADSPAIRIRRRD